ncbi:hypothetical protein WK77_16805 [Burkholderia ubonensis]|nr:hypothetical protein WK77_16805 [Burkholderia ubonensis]
MSMSDLIPLTDEQIAGALTELGEDVSVDRVAQVKAKLERVALPYAADSEAVKAAVDAARRAPDVVPLEDRKMLQLAENARLLANLVIEQADSNGFEVDAIRETVDQFRKLHGISATEAEQVSAFKEAKRLGRDKQADTTLKMTENEYAFECTLTAAIRVKAKSLEEAEDRIRAVMDAADCNGGLWPNGEPVLFEASINDSKLDLYEVNGESVEDMKLRQERGVLAEIETALVQAIEGAGFAVSGPTDSRAAEHGEPAWVCNARGALAQMVTARVKLPVNTNTSGEANMGQTVNEYGVPEGTTHFVDGLFGGVQFLQYRQTSRIAYFSEFQGDRWEPMGTQPSARGITPRDIAEYALGLPHEEFVSVMHAVWLADGDASRAAQLLGVAEDRIWQMNAGQADSAFCGRPADWKAGQSRDHLRSKGFTVEDSHARVVESAPPPGMSL